MVDAITTVSLSPDFSNCYYNKQSLSIPQPEKVSVQLQCHLIRRPVRLPCWSELNLPLLKNNFASSRIRIIANAASLSLPFVPLWDATKRYLLPFVPLSFIRNAPLSFHLLGTAVLAVSRIWPNSTSSAFCRCAASRGPSFLMIDLRNQCVFEHSNMLPYDCYSTIKA